MSLFTARTFGDRDDVLQLQVLDWEVDDGRVLLREVAVVNEALHMQHQVLRQLGDAVLPPAQLYVIVHSLPIKLLQELVDRHLQ